MILLDYFKIIFEVNNVLLSMVKKGGNSIKFYIPSPHGFLSPVYLLYVLPMFYALYYLI